MAVLAHAGRPWLSRVGTCRTCRQPLIDTARRGVHPTPECDPDTTSWWMTSAELADLAAHYWPTESPTNRSSDDHD